MTSIDILTDEVTDDLSIHGYIISQCASTNEVCKLLYHATSKTLVAVVENTTPTTTCKPLVKQVHFTVECIASRLEVYR
jgi:hypothetical protein